MAYSKKPLAAALGAAFLATTVAPMVSADSNPFAANQLSGGYDLVSYNHHEGEKKAEGKCGEGKCGEGKAKAEGKCGEGKCGEGKAKAEGKCGEGKCGEGKAKAEGKCGGDKAEAEGKCGGA
jgi:uncharacterized low-complexity protein